ncbi:aryl hydrocarbon receptor 2 [Cololabis saira]|uniref:aryl hydrocarbon receptor 2 n=1 Tax=Cololabis saira TaxID=129043 RepID=UPI002AD3EE4D|nr:aryl hydrocarbon receptor 2 [Cololabis saira]
MMSSTSMYAAKKRKKPVQKTPKPPPPEGAKSNPSKRHRDRLNGELDKLTSLLPFTDEVRNRLDKLSVLRLSVGYLKVKSFFNAALKAGQTGSGWTGERSLLFGGAAVPPASAPPLSTSIDGVSFSEGELLLQALNGFVLVVTAEGYIFYTSPTIQDFLGFHQSDVVHQSVFELIHTDDRAIFRRQLHFSLNPNSDGSGSPSDQNSTEISTNVVAYDPQAIPPENSSFLERNFCCRFRCLLDNSSGFLPLSFCGRLKLLHGQNQMSEDGALIHPQLALFAIATPLQQPSIMEIRTKTLLFQSKHKLDFTPLGIDTRGKVVLGYNEIELCLKGSGYNFIHAADMMYCAENHIRMMKTGDTGFTIFRLLAKSGKWVWVQSNARLVFKGGKPDFIVARQRALTNEEGEEQLRLRRLQLPFTFTKGEGMLYDTVPSIEDADPCSAPKQRRLDDDSISRNSLLGCMLSQDQSIYCEHSSASSLNSLSDVAFQDTHATITIPGDATGKAPAGSLMKVDPTVQDMVETLQQIFGDGDLLEEVDVGPEELKDWETALLNMNFSTRDLSEDLNDILSNDILSYVEDQLQKEEGLKLPHQLAGLPASLATPDQNPDRGGQQDFSWPLQTQGTPAKGTMKLSHIDFLQMDFSGCNGPPPQQVSSGNLSAAVASGPSHALMDCSHQTHSQLRTFQVNATDFSQLQNPYVAPATQKPQDQISGGASNSMLSFQSSQWTATVSNPGQADTFVPTYTPNISSAPSFSADPSLSRCLGGFPAPAPTRQPQRLSWPQQQQHQQQQQQQTVESLAHLPGFQMNSVDVSPVCSRPAFRGPDPSGAPFPVQQDCMFGNAPSLPPNGVQLSQMRAAPVSSQTPSHPPCFYQPLPGGGAVPPVTAIPNPDEAALSYQMAAGLKSNGLLMAPPHFLSSSQHTQIPNHPIATNGGFPFSSLPNGNTCFTANK